jgi:hypothetical protein
MMAAATYFLNAQDVRLSTRENDLVVMASSASRFEAGFSFSTFRLQDVKTPEGNFTRILAGGYARQGDPGSPELPVLSRLIEAPAGASASVKLLDLYYRDYTLDELGINYRIFPKQPPVPKTGQVDFAFNGNAYLAGGFGPVEPVSVVMLGTLRGTGIGRLDISPVTYDPVAKVLRIVEQIEFEVTFHDFDEQYYNGQKHLYFSHSFSPAFQSLPNFTPAIDVSRDTVASYPTVFVIVSDRMFEDALQPFIQWKARKGFTVIEAYTDDPEVGNTTFQIKSYLQGLYENAGPENPAPSYVLFVGDIEQVPTWTGQAAGHVTDLFYCEYTGDYFPEAYYGRFSANSVAQVQPQIDKTLMYEQYTMPDPTYLDSVVMIAGMDGNYGPVHANGQIIYGIENYFNDTLGIYSYTYLYPESGSQAAAIRKDISDGVTYANYTAHGSPSGWADPAFTVSHIPAMANEGKYGLLVGNCCSTSEYQVGECFGEALLRAEDKGAVGYIGASNSTYWDEDYYWGVGVGPISGDPPSYGETDLGAYDRAFHTHGETFDEWYTTTGQMIFAGNLAVTAGSPGMAQYYWEAYCIMGDPSLMVYFSEPPALDVSYDPLIPLGSASFIVTTEPYAYVALSMEGVLLGAALAGDEGIASVPIPDVVEPGTADVVVTKQNAQPFFGTVLIANPEGPYVMMNNYLLHDSPSANGVIEYGEEVAVDMELKNWGSVEASSVLAALSTASPFITISGADEQYGTIPPHDSIFHAEAFYFEVADSIPDQHLAEFEVVVQDSAYRGVWNTSFSVILNAPVLAIGPMVIHDTINGNGNNRLDPGETASLAISLLNNGHCNAPGALAVITSESPWLTILADSVPVDTLFTGVTCQAVFIISTSEETPVATVVPLSVSLAAGPYHAEKTFQPPVGLILEDFETGNFDAFPWIHSGVQPWLVQSEEIYEGNFAAMSGDIGDSQVSIITLDMDVLMDDTISFFRKVSCEDDLYNDNYDWLAFYIDDVEMDRWDGELDWMQFGYPVTEGVHTFKWVYSKDYSVSNGSDAAWIDYIVFPAVPSTIGLPDNPAKSGSGFNIYPNPARQKVHISYDLPEAGPVSVSISDILGGAVREALLSATQPAGQHFHVIDLSGLDEGIYFITFRYNGEQLTRKLVIVR